MTNHWEKLQKVLQSLDIDDGKQAELKDIHEDDKKKQLAHAEVLQLVIDNRKDNWDGPITVEGLFNEIEVDVSDGTVRNRLNKLSAVGMLACDHSGKTYKYTLAVPPEEESVTCEQWKEEMESFEPGSSYVDGEEEEGWVGEIVYPAHADADWPFEKQEEKAEQTQAQTDTTSESDSITEGDLAWESVPRERFVQKESMFRPKAKRASQITVVGSVLLFVGVIANIFYVAAAGLTAAWFGGQTAAVLHSLSYIRRNSEMIA